MRKRKGFDFLHSNSFYEHVTQMHRAAPLIAGSSSTLDALLRSRNCGQYGEAANTSRSRSQSVSKAIADLENTLGVRLLDRLPQGLTDHLSGRAFLKLALPFSTTRGTS